MESVNTIGRRKTAVARAYCSPGKGSIVINGKPINEYFTTEMLQYVVMQPLTLLGVGGNYDFRINLDGGGNAGQAEAVRLAITRALMEMDPETRPRLKQPGFVTRDPREVERKKPGRRKARKRFQFSKR